MGLFGFNKKETATITKEAATLGRLFLIDYENTSDTGLIGLSRLTKSDELVIFFGSNNNSISFNSLEMIHLAACRSTIEKCERSAKNYLDFRLVSYLGMRLGKEQFSQVVIVSNDMGYDAVVEFWSEQGMDIHRQAAIDEAVKAPTPKKSTNKKTILNEINTASTDKANEKKIKDLTSKKSEKKPKKSDIIKAEKKTDKSADIKTEKKAEKQVEKTDTIKAEKKAKKKNSKKAAIENQEPISMAKAALAPATDDKVLIANKPAPQPQSAAKSTLAEADKKKVRQAVKEMSLQPNQYSLIYAAFMDSNDLESFHNSLARKMGPRGSEIYKLTKNVFETYSTKKAGV